MEQPEMVVDEKQERVAIWLPAGMTVGKIVHQKPGSPGIADPLNVRERVVIQLKKQDGWGQPVMEIIQYGQKLTVERDYDLHCPSCGWQTIVIDTGGGDYYVGPQHYCLNCHVSFTYQGPVINGDWRVA